MTVIFSTLAVALIELDPLSPVVKYWTPTTKKMADARALLRAERASRRIKHPHASYTSDGKLLCNLCETLVKSEAQWQSHLHSTQHTLRSQRQQDAAVTRETTSDGGAKKRKAESPESPPQERKKAKAGPGPDRNQVVDGEEAIVQEQPPAEDVPPLQQKSKTAAEPEKANGNDINEADILAFERELDDLEADAAKEEQQARQEAVRNAATISAAPMTAEELAAQAREEQSAQRGKRDAELEDEREDAARVLEEEFDEMEGLEERVRKLRERREKLRTEASPDAGGGGSSKAVAAKSNPEVGAYGNAREVEESSDEDDDEDFDEWKFGGN